MTVPNATQSTALTPEHAKTAYDFVNSIGVNTHLNYLDRSYGNFERVERELKCIGIRHLRDGIHFADSHPDGITSTRWSALGAIGISFDAVLDPRNSLGLFTPAKLDEIETAAGGAIDSFEGPNEMDVSNVAGWNSIDRTYQQDIYRAAMLMRVAHSIAVIGPSMAFAAHGWQVGNISDWADYGNLHPYPAAKMPAAVLSDQIRLATELSGSKRVMITESGYHNALHDHHDQPAVSEAAAAKYIPRLFLEDFSWGIPRTYLYEFMDEASNPQLNDLQMHWGLIRSDGSEKPAFIAMKNLISELGDTAEPATTQELTYSLAPVSLRMHHLLLQRSDGQFDLILWQEVPSYDPQDQRDLDVQAQAVVLTLARRARVIRTYEPAASSGPLEVYADISRIVVKVPDHPLVIQIALQ